MYYHFNKNIFNKLIVFGNYKNRTIKNKQITPFRVSVNDIKKEKSSVIYSSSDYTKFKRFKTINQKLIERIKV